MVPSMPAQTYLQHEEHPLVHLLVPAALAALAALAVQLTRYPLCLPYPLLRLPVPADLQGQLLQ